MIYSINRFLLKYLQPWVLLTAACLRTDLFSALYMCGFLVLMLWNPSRFLSLRITVVKITTYVLVAVSLIYLLGQFVYNMVALGKDLESCGQATDILNLIGPKFCN